MSKFIIEYDKNEVDSVAKKLINLFKKDNIVIAMSGSLGVGKTTLVSSILNNLGISEPIVSPTFTYLNNYLLSDNKNVYHFDLYRLNNLNEFLQAGFDEYLYSDKSICLIEWPEIISSILPPNTISIKISINSNNNRLVSIYKI